LSPAADPIPDGPRPSVRSPRADQSESHGHLRFLEGRADDRRCPAAPLRLEALHRSASVVSLDWKRLERELAARAADIKGLLARHVPKRDRSYAG
jgi:hypothetical protein